MSPLYERNGGRQMNSLQLEQRKMSSFFSISIVHTGGFLLREYPYALRPFCQREVSSTEKKNKPTYLCFIPIASF